jgi:signal transduction histidine kinase/CheY-like chemotaxis protein/HPt (histidine-containing phosphotransfer) domain-containing protein
MKKVSKNHIKIKISIAFTLAFIAFIVVQYLSNDSIKNLRASEQQMLNARLFSNKIVVSRALAAQENKLIDYIVTGNKSFLVDHEKNLRKATMDLQDLHNFSLSDEQKGLVSRLDSLLNAEIQFCRDLLIAYDKPNKADAIALINTGKDAQIMNDIFKTTNYIRKLDDDKLAAMIRNNESYSNKVIFLNYTATVFAAMVILFSIIILYRYINKRIKVERELIIANQKAQQSAIVKENFMANMSHEIRTPMNAILGFTNLLQKEPLNEKTREFVSSIQNSGENLLTIINDILDFSKIEAGMMRIESNAFSLRGLLHSVQTMFGARIQQKDLQFTVNVEEPIPDILVGDAIRLTQILVNLVNNSVKFTNTGGIYIRVIAEEDKDDVINISFSVKDTGIGIPSDKMNTIFERFQQADEDTTRKYGGTGLGLSIVKQLVELQHGTISVSSVQNMGTEFIFTIPYMVAKNLTAKNKVALLSGYEMMANEANMKILVAEDNAMNQSLMKHLLSDWKLDFHIVNNGEEAIEALKQEKYSLVLMDIQMPLLDGYRATEKIRNELKNGIPIIAMTAHAMAGEREKCLRYGMDEYISKPIRENELFKILNTLLHRNKFEKVSEKPVVSTADNTFKVINLQYLEELSGGNKAFEKTMLNQFLQQAPGELDAIENEFIKSNFNVVKRIAHNMKTTVAFLGLTDKLAHALDYIESNAGIQNKNEHVQEKIMLVKKICLEALQELKEYLGT